MTCQPRPHSKGRGPSTLNLGVFPVFMPTPFYAELNKYVSYIYGALRETLYCAKRADRQRKGVFTVSSSTV